LCSDISLAASAMSSSGRTLTTTAVMIRSTGMSVGTACPACVGVNGT
jgi:hypothetical protein